MKVWEHILASLEKNLKVCLLFVVDSKGSSPGRKGFRMSINEQGGFWGTIGGGIMEIKLLELARDMLKKGESTGLIKQQYHDKQHAKNQSGMICSGEQTVIILPLTQKDIPTIQALYVHKGGKSMLCFSPKSLSLLTEPSPEYIQIKDEKDFLVQINLPSPPRVHILGGGHVGLALSQVLSLMEFELIIYDERPNLNTLEQNQFAHKRKIVDFSNILESVEFHADDIVVIVTFSYRTDKILLKQLYDKKFSYIGMMGSDAKIVQLYKELIAGGIAKKDLAHIHAPIGIEIYSKTTLEIAISISGQIIKEINKHLPTGRNYENNNKH